MTANSIAPALLATAKRQISTRLAPTLRRASPDDIPAITELINLAYQVESFFVDGDRIDRDTVDEMFERGHFLVIESADRGLAASVYLEVTGTRGYFGLLSVHPAHRGSGLGKRLVTVAEGLCQADGCTSMDLSVVSLRAELKPWYRSLGYREYGTEPFPSSTKVPCHMILMSKALERRPV